VSPADLLWHERDRDLVRRCENHDGHVKVDKATAYLLKDQTKKQGWQPGQMRGHLKNRFGVDSVRELSAEQAEELRAELGRVAEAKRSDDE